MNRLILSLVLSSCVWSGVAVACESEATSASATQTTAKKAKVGFRMLYGAQAPQSMGISEAAPASWRLPQWKGPVSAEFSTRADGSLSIALSIEANGAKKKVKEAVLKAGERITLEPDKDVTAGYFGEHPEVLAVEFTGPYQPKKA